MYAKKRHFVIYFILYVKPLTLQLLSPKWLKAWNVLGAGT